MKSKISAQIIADSVNANGDRLTTFILTFPRFILPELATHRVFSKNSASSRAIPFSKMCEMVENDPFIPIAWQKDHKGMQGTKYFKDEYDISVIENLWLNGRDKALECAKSLRDVSFFKSDEKVTKQLCNRLLESFLWHTVILSGTTFDNFFKLRCPRYECDGIVTKSKKELIAKCDVSKLPNNDWSNPITWLEINKGQAEIHLMELAEQMYDAYNESKPTALQDGEWHIPFRNKCEQYLIDSRIAGKEDGLREMLKYGIRVNDLLKLSTALCARVSYLRQDVFDGYKELFNKLKESEHWSPFEHCAQAMGTEYVSTFNCSGGVDEDGNWEQVVEVERSNQYRNFTGFKQLRQILEETK